MLALQTRKSCYRCGYFGRPRLTGLPAKAKVLLWPLVLASLVYPIFLIFLGALFLWLFLTREVVCDQCGKEILSFDEMRANYSHSGDSDDDHASKAGKRNYKSEEPRGRSHVNDKNQESGAEGRKEVRVFNCPGCAQRIRVTTPLPEGVGKCVKCETRFLIRSDESGNLYIYPAGDVPQDDANTDLDLNECCKILGVDWYADEDVVRAAYKKMMREYHPDKVSGLGKELQALAEKKSKQINAAYMFLKKRGRVC